MNRFMTAVAATITLLLVQSCSSSPKAQEQLAVTSTKQHNDEHSAQQHNSKHFADADHHEGHSISEANAKSENASAQAKLTTPRNLTPNAPVPLVIDIQDSTGKAIANFDTFHEQLMHLIVVSNDLSFFNHLHPSYKGNGSFEVDAQFPKSGNYTLFSDYKPSGKAEQVSVLNIQVPGNASAAPNVNFDRTKTFTNTRVDLELSNSTVKAGEEIAVTFNLRETANNQPVTDLQPYMGERGHLVILRQSSALTRADYIHAHAASDATPGQVQFMTRFPEPGTYKLWGQFNRNGEIITADFWVNVI